MNGFQFPYMPNPYPPQNMNLQEEINRLKREIKRLEQRITKLEKQEKNDYLTKEDGIYML